MTAEGCVVSSGGTASGTTVDSGSESIFTGGIASGTVVGGGGNENVGFYTSGFQLLGGTTFGTTVNGGGTESVWSGGTASSTILLSGGNGLGTAEDVFAGGTTVDTIIDSGAQLHVSSGGAASGTIVTGGGSDEFVLSGGVASGTNVSGGGLEQVGFYTSGFQLLGGATIGTTVSSGGVEKVWSGGTASGTVVSSGGTVDVLDGGTASGTVILNGGTLELFGGAVAGGTTISSGGILEIGSGYAVSGYVAGSGGTLEMASSGTASGTIVSSGGTLELLGGAIVSGATLSSGSFLEIASGYALNGYVTSGGVTLEVAAGGSVSGAAISSGATLDVLDGGTLAGAVANDGTVNYDIAGSATFSGTLTGSGTLVVSGGGHLDVASAYTGAAQVNDASTLEFTGTYVGAATFSGAPTGPGGTLKLDVPSTGPITVVNSNDTVIAQPGNGSWIDAIVSYTLPTHIDTLFLFAGAQGTGNSDASGDALYALDPSHAQTLTGNSPNDAFVVYHNASDVVVPKAGSHDTVYAAASYTLPTGVDALFLEGTAAQGTGNSDAAGDALYAANPGQVATLTGNSANDVFVVYNSSDVVVPKAGSHDSVYSAVSYTLPTGVDVLFLEAGTHGTGNSDASGDALYAADAGIAQTLTGNSANDTFVVYNSADVVALKAGSHDTVYSAVNYTLPTGVDVLFLEAGTQGVGNNDAAGDVLYAANAGIAQTLTGHSHNDSFVVYNSADVVAGQAGSTDTVYAAANFTQRVPRHRQQRCQQRAIRKCRLRQHARGRQRRRHPVCHRHRRHDSHRRRRPRHLRVPRRHGPRRGHQLRHRQGHAAVQRDAVRKLHGGDERRQPVGRQHGVHHRRQRYRDARQRHQDQPDGEQFPFQLGFSSPCRGHLCGLAHFLFRLRSRQRILARWRHVPPAAASGNPYEAAEPDRWRRRDAGRAIRPAIRAGTRHLAAWPAGPDRGAVSARRRRRHHGPAARTAPAGAARRDGGGGRPRRR